MTATEVNQHVAALEDFINGGIAGSDLQTSPAWVKHEHIDPADFYGAPAPRWEGVGSVIHHRHTNSKRVNAALFADDVSTSNSATSWVTVHGLAARVRCHPQVARTVGMEVCAAWHAYEFNGSQAFDADNFETKVAAQFKLFINGTEQVGTERVLYRSTSSFVKSARKHHTVNFFAPDIGDGIHDVSIKIKVNQSSLDAGNRNHKFVWVLARTLTAKVVYL
tara:strand:+ start:1112 stop:1774 length:663 start_codon:yes stop_codon:yes gene_type:complete